MPWLPGKWAPIAPQEVGQAGSTREGSGEGVWWQSGGSPFEFQVYFDIFWLKVITVCFLIMFFFLNGVFSSHSWQLKTQSKRRFRSNNKSKFQSEILSQADYGGHSDGTGWGGHLVWDCSVQCRGVKITKTMGFHGLPPSISRWVAFQSWFDWDDICILLAVARTWRSSKKSWMQYATGETIWQPLPASN